MENKNREKLKFRFNFIDAILIAVIIGAAVFLAYIFSSSSLNMGDENSSAEIEYTVELSKVRDEFRGESFIKNGDGVTDSVTLYAIGEVSDVAYSDYMNKGYAADGSIVYSKYPNHMTVTVTIRAKADLSDGTYSIGGYTMAVGKKVSLRVPNFTGEGYCTAIREING